MLPGRKYKPEDFVGLLWKRRWYVIIPLFLCTFGALLVSSTQPDVFEAETTVQVLPQRVPDSYVRSTVTSTVEERLKMLAEVLRSRTHLEQLINAYNLYPETRKRQPMEDIVEVMRTSIDVVPVTTGPGNRRIPGPPTSFRVSFEYHDKTTALKVTQRLTELLIQENARLRGNLAEQTNEFLVTQLADAERRLRAQETKLEAFRRQHSGRLPTQLDANLQSVQSVRQQLESVADSVSRDRDQKMMLERLLADQTAELNALLSAPPPAAVAPPNDPTGLPRDASASQRLATARENLTQLEMRLTSEHPDVIRARRQVRDLEQQVAAESERPSSTPTVVRSVSPAEQQRRERISQLRAEIDSYGRRVAFKEAEEARLRAQLGDYQSRINAVPGVESEYIALSRDYETLNDNYKVLLQKSEDSKVAANLERRQIGEQFTVLDAPRVSDQATSTNRIRTNLIGLAAGLLLGLGLVGFLEYMDTTFRSETDVINALSLPVLAAVPFAPTTAETEHRKRRRLMFSGAVVATLCISAVVFWRLQLWRFVV
jgi:polysaccharide chain length determinant protein (PEP-CTERM system associated)